MLNSDARTTKKGRKEKCNQKETKTKKKKKSKGKQDLLYEMRLEFSGPLSRDLVRVNRDGGDRRGKESLGIIE